MNYKTLGLTALLTTAIGALSAAPPAPPTGKQWKSIPALSDEFNGGTIDSNKWYDYHPFWQGRLPSLFKRGNAFQAGGHLQLRTTSRIDNMNEVSRPFEDHWIDAAAVVSKAKAKVGGYYECQMKAADLATSSSFWFRVGKFSEIDVIEHIGRATKGNQTFIERQAFDYHANAHYYGIYQGVPSQPTRRAVPRRGRDGLETYGLWWKDARTLIMYYNDVEWMTIKTTRDFNEELRMIFDTEALASQFFGLPTIASLKDNDKNTMRVNWVRSYELTDAPVTSTSAVPTVGQKVAFRDRNGNFLSSSNGTSPMISNRTAALGWETFTIVNAGDGYVGLRGSNGKYVSHENGNPMTCNRDRIGAWEKFKFEPLPDNKFAIRDARGFYTSFEGGTRPVVSNRTAARSWETWSFILR